MLQIFAYQQVIDSLLLEILYREVITTDPFYTDIIGYC